jgi:uncharacterized membrane protein (UPF0127 family)
MFRNRSAQFLLMPLALVALLTSSCLPTTTPPTPAGATTATASAESPRLQVGGRTLRVLLAETTAEHADWPQRWPEAATGLPVDSCVVLDQAGLTDRSGRINARSLRYAMDALYVRDGKIIAIARNMAPCQSGFTKQDITPRTAESVEPRTAEAVQPRTAEGVQPTTSASAQPASAPGITPVSAAPVQARNVDDLLVETDGGCTTYRLMGSVDYLVELPAGSADAWGLKAGDALTPIPAKANVTAAAVGTWDMQIPGVAYSTGSGNDAKTVIAPGASFGRLTIAADGIYTWDKSGTTVRDRLQAIAPRQFSSRWHQSYSIRDDRETFYFDRTPEWLASYKAEDPNSDNAVAKGKRQTP